MATGLTWFQLRGSQNRDEITKDGFQSNHAGGILGGISSGQQIIAHMALKPTSSITVPGRTINRFGEEVEMITKGRHDPCVGIRGADRRSDAGDRFNGSPVTATGAKCRWKTGYSTLVKMKKTADCAVGSARQWGQSAATPWQK